MNRPDVSIVIVTYNAPDSVRECLAALQGPGAPTVSSELIVLDNNSTPSLMPMLTELLPGADVVDVGENIGFGRACNMGASRASGRYVLLLNPDAVIHPGAIDTLVRAADAERAPGIVGGRTVDAAGRTDPRSCWGRPTLWSLFCFATGLSTAFRRNPVLDPESLGRWDRTTERDVDVVTGCLLLAPKPLWDDLGGFDPAYFMYGEDADLCRRARAAGRRVWIEPRAVARHDAGASSASSGAKTVLLLAGRMTYVDKQFSGLSRLLARRLLMGGVALRGLLAQASGRRQSGWVHAWARRRAWGSGYPLSETA